MPAQAAPLPTAIRAQAKAIRPLALEYCAKKAMAEVLRDRVDAIARQLLAEECPLYMTLNEDGGRVIDPKDYWLAEDEDALKAYYAAMNRDLRAAGIKPDDMDDDYCPALVAEHDVVRARAAVINAVAPMVGLDLGLLYGEKEEQFFQLAMELILKA